MKGLFKPVPKLIKAKQLEKVLEIIDSKTGLKFIGQIGDWLVYHDDGYIEIMNYYQFIERYMPYNILAFLMYEKKLKIRNMRGKLLRKVINNLGE